MSRRASGLKAWVLQRFSALILAAGLLAVLGVALFAPPADYAAWHKLVSGRLVMLGIALFFLALAAHAWVGIRDILIDYVHSLGARLVLLCGVALVLSASLLWMLDVLLGVRGS